MATDVVQGEDKKLTVKLVRKACEGECGDPFDLTPFDDIQFCIRREDGTVLTLSTTTTGVTVLGNLVLGKIQVNISDIETALLEVGLLGFEVRLIDGSELDIVQFPLALNIVETLC
jgi:hypothetical protein